jgi:hypothetical protein
MIRNSQICSQLHCLTAKDLVVRDDEREEFEALQADLTAELDPQGALEMLTFNRLLHAAWNLNRFRRLESSLMASGLDPLLDDSAAKTLDRLYRYATAADRAYTRALNELRTLQTERALRRVKLEPAQRAITPKLASVNQIVKPRGADSADRALNLAIQMIDREPEAFQASSFRKKAA